MDSTDVCCKVRPRVCRALGAEQEADVNKSKWTPLMFAALIGNVIIAAFLLDKGAHIDAVQEYQFTAFMIAAAKGNTDVAKLLLNQDANTNVVNNGGRTCLSLAAGKGHLDLVISCLMRISTRILSTMMGTWR